MLQLARKQAEYRQEKLNPNLKDERVERQRARKAAPWLKANKGVMKRSQQDMIQARWQRMSHVVDDADMLCWLVCQ